MPEESLFPTEPAQHPLGEHPALRRERLDYNIRQQDVVRGWATKCGIFMRVTNFGHHWHFRKHGAQADWWPSTAKLVLQRDYKNILEVDDHEIAIEKLDEHFTEWEKGVTPVKAGQVWIDDYRRAPDKVRRLKVTAIEGDNVIVVNVKTRRFSAPKISMFYPTATGYRFEGTE